DLTGPLAGRAVRVRVDARARVRGRAPSPGRPDRIGDGRDRLPARGARVDHRPVPGAGRRGDPARGRAGRAADADRRAPEDPALPATETPTDELAFPALPAGVDTPRVVIDLARVDANIARLQAAMDARGIALRPHAKTHKSVAIARRQLAAGAHGITVG